MRCFQYPSEEATVTSAVEFVWAADRWYHLQPGDMLFVAACNFWVQSHGCMVGPIDLRNDEEHIQFKEPIALLVVGCTRAYDLQKRVLVMVPHRGVWALP